VRVKAKRTQCIRKIVEVVVEYLQQKGIK
jgi:hypothetical protein